MAFFIMMYAMSIVNKGKFDALAVSVRTGFGGSAPGALPAALQSQEHTLLQPGSLKPNEFQLLTAVEDALRSSIRKNRPQSSSQQVKTLMSQVKVVARGRDLILRVASGPITFARGSAELTPAARYVMAAVSDLLAGMPDAARIEGHTCNLPIRTARFPSNWELSGERAMNVLTYLIAKGITPGRLSAVAYADTVPLGPNVDEASRRRNRRVDIVVVGALDSGGAGLRAAQAPHGIPQAARAGEPHDARPEPPCLAVGLRPTPPNLRQEIVPSLGPEPGSP